MSHQLLGEVVTFVRGVTFDGSQAQATPRVGSVPILRAGNIGPDLKTDIDLVWVPASRVGADQFMRLGDIAICMSSGSPSVVGKSAILDHEFRGSVGAFCGLLRCSPRLVPAYLALWLRSEQFIDWRDSQSRGASIQNLRFTELAKVELALPSIDDQHQVVLEVGAEMRTASLLQEGNSQRLTDSDVLVQQVRQAAFDQLKPVDLRRLGHAGVLQDGDWILTADYAPDGVRLFQVGDIGRGRLLARSNRYISRTRAGELKCTLLRQGDVLISRMPDPIGRACVVPDLGYEAITAVDVAIFRPDPALLDSEYAVQFMNTRPWLQAAADKASGATRARISRLNLELLEIPSPAIETQRRIASELRHRLSAIEPLQESVRSAQEAINAIPAALLRRAFPIVAT